MRSLMRSLMHVQDALSTDVRMHQTDGEPVYARTTPALSGLLAPGRLPHHFKHLVLAPHLAPHTSTAGRITRAHQPISCGELTSVLSLQCTLPTTSPSGLVPPSYISGFVDATCCATAAPGGAIHL